MAEAGDPGTSDYQKEQQLGGVTSGIEPQFTDRTRANIPTP